MNASIKQDKGRIDRKRIELRCKVVEETSLFRKRDGYVLAYRGIITRRTIRPNF